MIADHVRKADARVVIENLLEGRRIFDGAEGHAHRIFAAHPPDVEPVAELDGARRLRV